MATARGGAVLQRPTALVLFLQRFVPIRRSGLSLLGFSLVLAAATSISCPSAPTAAPRPILTGVTALTFAGTAIVLCSARSR